MRTSLAVERLRGTLTPTATAMLRGTAELLRERLGSPRRDLESMSLERLALLVAALVTDRERSLEPAHRALAKLKIALDEHAMVSVTDSAGTITYVNEAFCRTSGFTARELVGQNHRVVSSGTHPRAFFADLWSTITRGEVWRGEICDRSKDGALQWTSATIVPIADPSGAPAEYVAVRHDITGRVEAERAAVAARATAEAAERAKSEILATVSHEIRTPLTGILGMTEIALSRPLDLHAREEIELARSAADALLELVNDLVDLSRVEAQKLAIESVPFSPRAEIADVVRLLKHGADQKGIALFEAEDGLVPPVVVGDPLRFRQVLLNLVGNALKFTERGAVSVEVSYQAGDGGSGWLDCHVRDTGVGISPERLDAIFEPFAQAEVSTPRKFGGSGLGLSIARRLVSLMGGVLGVQSELGKGSDFHFRLPLPVAPEVVRAAPLIEAWAGPLSVLVAEDCVVNQRIARTMLERQGCRVSTAGNGAAAVELVRREAFDLILMDVQMPVLDGLVATRLIRAFEAETGRVHAPIIALTASVTEDCRSICLGAGMSDHLAKPFAAQELREKVAAWSAGRSPAATGVPQAKNG